jgi:L-threonylcarbamoyladenylate synthase
VKIFHDDTLQDAAYDEMVSLLRSGCIIAFPTDTAYGLGGDPFNEAAVERIFEIKGRKETKPILMLVNSIAMAQFVIKPNPVFHAVASRFWPGPLTVILRAAPSVPSKVTAGTNTIGVRWPVAPFATTLVERFGKPLTATSANRSGMSSAITAEEVRMQLGDSVDALVDGGTLPWRGGSTLLDLTPDPPVLLREGPISLESLREFFKGRIRSQVA